MSQPGPVRRVRVRLLPWRPRWRVRDVPDWPDPGWVDLGDDALSVALGVLVLLVGLPVVVFGLFGLVLLSAELGLLLALVPFLLVGQVVGLLPWQLAVTGTDGTKRYVEARGTRQLLAALRHYRALRA